MPEAITPGYGDGGKQKRRAPTLYVIIVLKLLKGLSLLLLALGVYSLKDQDLPQVFGQALSFFHFDPENRFFAALADQIATISQAKMIWLAGGTSLYSLFSLVEGVGLIFRVTWIGWMTIGESAFFIPIELYELVRRHSTDKSYIGVLIVLALNVFILWYLFQNRKRLFRHHHHR
ncbi:MAG TPA: DUF2127 domain-containing protein [Verrucomicrobiae bacterium]|nr:DUF2127 domain-containing protein [Verrucomicrobiae bacterium]